MRPFTRICFGVAAAALVSGHASFALGMEVVSHQDAGDGGAQGNQSSVRPSVSADGKIIAFDSRATNLIPGAMGDTSADANGIRFDIFVLDRTTGALDLVSRQDIGDGAAQGNSDSFDGVVSGDGRIVAFVSQSSNLIPGGGLDVNGIRWDIFAFDRQTRSLQLISRQDPSDGGAQADFDSDNPAISADGRFVAFESIAHNLFPGGAPDVNGFSPDIFLFDRQTGSLELISRQAAVDGGAQANNSSFEPSVSGDGRFVAFSSSANNLVAGDTNNRSDIFVFDRQNQSVELVSRQTAADGGAQSNGESREPSISTDGRFVAFRSRGTNLIPGALGNPAADVNGSQEDIFVFDRQTGSLELISREDAGDGGDQANATSVEPAISGDGRFVTFSTFATNIIPGEKIDSNSGQADVFRFDRQTGGLELVSKQDPADGGAQANQASRDSAINADGSVVAFDSAATNLVVPDANPFFVDVFVSGASAPAVVANAGPDRTVECAGALTPVQLDGSASQPPSGLNYSWVGNFGSAMGVMPVVDLPLGQETITLTVDDGSGGTASDDVAVDVLDTIPPTILLDPLVELTATSALGAVYTVSPTVSDTCDSDVEVVVAPDLSVFPPGVTTVTVAATDDSGNVAMATQDVVVNFGCNAFQEPVASPPAVNTGKAGRTYPVKWQCSDGGDGFIADTGIVQSIQYTEVSCGDPDAAIENPMDADDAGQSGLRVDDSTGRYIYGWKSPGMPGCYVLAVGLTDGTALTALFDLF